MDKFESLVKERGLTVFVRIDHAAGAAKIGKRLRPTEEQNAKSLANIQPLVQWREALRQDEQRAA